MIEIACAADETYAPHAAAMLHSLGVAHRSVAVTAHVLHPPGLPATTTDRLREVANATGASIVFHEIGDGTVRDLPAMGRISRVMWYRLALPDLLPDTSRLLYLDCDTLVLESLTPLWELDLQDQGLAAVTNVFPPDLVHRPDDLGIPRQSYFNSGVLLLDLAAWRRHRFSERIVELARSRPGRLVFPDQDALNVELHDRWLPLHPRWNCQNSILYFSTAEDLLGPAPAAEARAHPAILHFEGPESAKPWHYLSTHPLRQLYFDHRAATPWPHVALEGRSVKNRVKRFLPEPVAQVLRAPRRLARAFGEAP